MSEKFKVGDDVFYYKYGWGKVVEDKTTDGMNSIKIRFKIGSTDVSGATAVLSDVVFATLEGKTETTDAFPSILTKEEAEKLGYFPPEKKVKYYPVLVRMPNDVVYATGGEFRFRDLEEAQRRVHWPSGTILIRLVTEIPELIEECTIERKEKERDLAIRFNTHFNTMPFW